MLASLASLSWSQLACCGAVLILLWRLVIRPMLPAFKLEGSCVVVTGCDYGFGRQIALTFAKEGATVFAGCLSASSGAKLVKLAGDGSGGAAATGRLIPLVMDVTKDADVDEAVKRVVASGLPLRAVVNNAGISAFGWAEMLPLHRYERNMAVNFVGVVRVTKAFMPLLRASKGRLVNMGSIGARMASAFGSAYLSTKCAMVSYTECVRQEVYRFGVSVATVEPGFFATELLAQGSANGAADSEACTDEVRAIYPSYEEKMAKTAEPIRLVEKLNGGARGLDYVTACVLDAARNPCPLSRYTIGWDAHLIRHGLVYVPSWIIDIIQTMQG